jgi:bifunctional pyridoxal-dependent enzyme with beta-cystathionase and maltose regulon repressor activities
VGPETYIAEYFEDHARLRTPQIARYSAPPPFLYVLDFQQIQFLRGFQEGVRYKARVLRNTGGVYGTYVEDFRRRITQ